MRLKRREYAAWRPRWLAQTSAVGLNHRWLWLLEPPEQPEPGILEVLVPCAFLVGAKASPLQISIGMWASLSRKTSVYWEWPRLTRRSLATGWTHGATRQLPARLVQLGAELPVASAMPTDGMSLREEKYR